VVTAITNVAATTDTEIGTVGTNTGGANTVGSLYPFRLGGPSIYEY
jgi:hypothetical protein